MTLLGALALWGCARRIWPENREAAVVALLLYAGTGQIWLNGMTAYAMPAHLTINLCWLWFVLRRRWWADRSEEHTSELQSLMRISYAVFCLNKKKNINRCKTHT